MNCANHPERERVAFCQNCGKPLCVECSRAVGQAVFCEPCLAAKLAAAGAFSSAASANGPGAPFPNGYAGTIPPPSAPGEPNPGLAALLGFIPGVGAFYNGQYAKGVVHLIVFAVLISLVDEHPIFGLFIAGWIFYQVIEAHHTARARRDGTPLPNPFGLNDIGERLGFGRSWPAGTPTTGSYTAPPPAAPASGAPIPPSATAYSAAAAQPPFPSNWGAPEESYGTPKQPPFASEQPYGAPWEAYAAGQPYVGVPPANPYAPPLPPEYATPLPTGRTLPTGAFVLIGLGTFFLIANTGHFGAFAIHWFLPFLLIGIGVWMFVRRMLSTGPSFADDGSAGYRLRLYSAARSALWPLLIGVLIFLDMARILTWAHSWPLLIVLAGVLALLRRAAYAGMPPAPFPGMPVVPVGAPAADPVRPANPMSIVPVDPKTDETFGDRS